jgi:hypothetical protein
MKNQELLIAAIELQRNLPVNFSSDDMLLFKHELKRMEPEVFLNRYRNVYVTDEGMILKNFLLEERHVAGPNKKFIDKMIYNLSILLPTLIKKTSIVLDPHETYLHVYDDWSNTYFHWLCDVLPRLSAVESIHKNCVLLLPEYAKSSYFCETISKWSFKDVFYIPRNSYVTVKNLVCPAKIACTGNYNPDIMSYLRKKFTSGSNLKQPTLKLYSSRRHAQAKFVINESEMMELLSGYGYESVSFEDYSVTENANLLENCKSLISMHGANLSNMMFMHEGTSVIEFRKKSDARNNAYFSLASALGINYFYQQCEFQSENYSHPNRFDLTVDLDKLEQLLKTYPTFL